MRSILLVVCWIATCGVVYEVSAAPPESATKPFGSDRNLFPYRFESGDRHYADLLTLTSGARYSGKVLEWAEQILLYDAAGRVTVYPLSDVALFETRRSDRLKAKPDLPDLTVAYISRGPRSIWRKHIVTEDGLSRLNVDPKTFPRVPKAGDKADFRVHILNAGAKASTPVPYRVQIDDKDVASETLPPLKPGEERIVEFSWPWGEGSHTLRVEIDPDGKTPEIARWNNTFVEPIRALAVGVIVSRDRYEAFQSTPNMVDTFCFEDYIQYHIRNLNALFAASIYPSTPQGVLERVRCDRIEVVDDPDKWRNIREELLSKYDAALVLGPVSKDENIPIDALKVDWRLLQQIGFDIGLVDPHRTDTTLQQCYVHDKFGRYAQRRHLSPWIRTLMYTPAGFPLAEHEAAFLNHTLGRPRGFVGDYLYQIPANVVLEILSVDGTPIEGVQVDVFQLQSTGKEPGRITGVGRDDPLFSTLSDAAGRAPLANLPTPSHKTPGGYELHPNPFGKIATDGSNGLLLLRLRSGNAEAFHFLPLTRLNIAAARGATGEYVHPVRTHFGVTDGPVAPLDASGILDDRSTERPPLILTWKVPKDYDYESLDEFRIYKRISFAGEETKPWTLSSFVRRGVDGRWDRRSTETYFDEYSYDGPYGLDTFFAVSAVDKDGRESSLSEPSYYAHEKRCLKFAVQGIVGYMTLAGEGGPKLLFWDPVAGTQPYGVKTDRSPGYEPAFEGIAFTKDKNLIVTDPVNHVLAIYDPDLHELIETFPRRDTWPGVASDAADAFSDPADIAVDKAGNLYVADRGNDRVRILDPHGKPKGLLDADFRFKRPHAIAHANGHICVTDKGGARCRVYDIRSDEAKFVCELPPLFDADRALVNKSGKVFITGRMSEDEEQAILAFVPMGDTVGFNGTREHTLASMGKYYRPHSLFLYVGGGDRFGYMVNDFPFDVRRMDLEAK